MSIIRGTTPTLTIDDLPIEADNIASAFVTINQLGRTVIEKTLQDCRVEGKKISVRLSQEETLSLSHKYPVRIQLAVKTVDTNVVKSYIWEETVGETLKEGVI